MADNYTPQFQHQDWRDNVDLVSAEDPVKGFNKRFNDLQKEFQEISRIISQINGSLAPSSTTLTFAPSFLPNGTSPQWTFTNGIAAKGTTQTVADGWIAVQLPQNSRIQTIKVVGEKNVTSGSIGIFEAKLIRQSFTGGATTLLTLDLAAEPDSFQPTVPVPAPNNLIDNQTNKYIVTASIVGAAQAATARIFAIQFVCSQG